MAGRRFPRTFANNMKRKQLIAHLGILSIVAVTAWFFGYVKGNADGTYRSSVSSLVFDFKMRKEIAGSGNKRAIEHNEAMIAANYNYLKANHFWYYAMRDQFTVDTDHCLHRYEHEAARIEKRVFAGAVFSEQAVQDMINSKAPATRHNP